MNPKPLTTLSVLIFLLMFDLAGASDVQQLKNNNHVQGCLPYE